MRIVPAAMGVTIWVFLAVSRNGVQYTELHVSRAGGSAMSVCSVTRTGNRPSRTRARTGEPGWKSVSMCVVKGFHSP